MTATPDPAAGRFRGVQALRFLAALLVVITHATFYAQERLTPSLTVWHVGEVGVDIFFVISGFVMVVSSRGLLGEPDGWKFFAVRRIVRIVPIYWLATTVKLLTLLLASGVVLHAQLGWNVPLSYLFLPSTNIDGDVQPLLSVGWTLTYEMFFYFLFTLALLLRRDPLRFCGTALTALAVVGVFRTDDWPAATVYFHPRVLYFLAGMVIARFAMDRARRPAAVWLSYVVALFVAVQVGPRLAHAEPVAAWNDVMRPVAAIALVLVVVLAEPFLVDRLPRSLTFMGDASYSLYLFHPLIGPAAPAALAILGWHSAPLSVLGTVGVAVVVAALVYRFVERPITRRLLNTLPYVRPPVASPAAALVAG